jgi:hypothetical protein
LSRIKGINGICLKVFRINYSFKILIMAKQNSIIPFLGTVDNMTFYQTQDGNRIKKKQRNVIGSRIANNPAFQRTRENCAEFGRAGSAGKMLRSGLRELINQAGDARVVSRVLKQMMAVIKSDATNDRGKRTIIDGNVELLEGFDFNIVAPFSTTFFAPYTAAIDRAGGQFKLDVPAFIPTRSTILVQGATHFRLLSAGLDIDFANEKVSSAILSSAEIALDNTAIQPVSLVNALTPNSTNLLVMVVGIEFLQSSNGKLYPLLNKNANSLAIVKVSGV